jgi:hypothetical protein
MTITILSIAHMGIPNKERKIDILTPLGLTCRGADGWDMEGSPVCVLTVRVQMFRIYLVYGFALLSFICCFTVPWDYPGISNKPTTTSPFTIIPRGGILFVICHVPDDIDHIFNQLSQHRS